MARTNLKERNVEEVQRNVEQFHGCEHRAHGKKQGGFLDQPKPPISIKNSQENGIENGHECADENNADNRTKAEDWRGNDSSLTESSALPDWKIQVLRI